MTFKNSKSIEVRNITFEDYTEDACSFEGSDPGLDATSANAFEHGRFWVHHNTFEEGVNYWDVCKEQDKHDGDGSTDIKRVAYVTFAYNVYNQTHKTGLVGSDDNVVTASVTFHHNLYNGCKSRLPLARRANMHIYNNYYKGTTSTDISLRGTAYALVENCYFEQTTNSTKSVNFDLPEEKIKNGVHCGVGYAKVVGSKFTDATGKTVSATKNFGTGVPESNLKLNASRGDKLNTENKYGSNFDTDSSVFYYKNGQSDVKVLHTADEAKTNVEKYAGVQKRGNTITEGAGSGTTPEPSTPTTGNAGTYTYSFTTDGVSCQPSTGAESNGDFVTTTGGTLGSGEFKYGASTDALTLSLNVKAGQTVTLTLKARSGSSGNDVTLVSSVSDSTILTLNGSDTVTFSSSTYPQGTDGETQIITYTANEAGQVTITVKRGGKTVKLQQLILNIAG